nr:sigma-70 family RNA polymerase sigma factor [candidate division Zixibacteria bacterium]
MKTDRRKTFEEDTFPHLEALRRTALWLTIHDSIAEDLVLNTMARAYDKWSYTYDLVSNKTRLFKVLTREFLGFGKERQKWYHSGQYLSENISVTSDPEAGNPRNSISVIEQLEQRLANGFSEKFVRHIIVRLRPQSRLILSLLYIGEFSYADIAFITDISRNSVRAILARVRKLIPEYMLEYAECLDKKAKKQPAFMWHGVESNVENTNVLSKRPILFFLKDTTDAAFAKLKNNIY